MANKKQQRKAQKAWKKKQARTKNPRTFKSAIDTNNSNKPSGSSLSIDFEKALEKDRQELDRRIELKAEQAKAQTEYKEKNFQEKRAEQDRADYQNASNVDIGMIIYSNIVDLIETYPTNCAGYLSKLLKSEISTYGFKNVMYALANSPHDMVSKAQSIVYMVSPIDNPDIIHSALRQFSDLIRSALPTENEAKELGQVMDEMTHMDMY